MRHALLGLALLLGACAGDGGLVRPDTATGTPDAAADAGAEPRPDANVAAPDAGPPPGPDAGIPDQVWGACDCTYGFHHQCPQGQVCVGGQRYRDGEYPGGLQGRPTGQNVCQPMKPRGGALHGGCNEPQVGTEALMARESCDAVCVPAEDVRLCSGRSAEGINEVIDAILTGFAYGYGSQPNLCSDVGCGSRFHHPSRYWTVRNQDLDCADFLATTALGFMQLCAGDLLPSGWHSPFGYVHQTPAHTPVESLVEHQCAETMGVRCMTLLSVVLRESEPEIIRDVLVDQLGKKREDACAPEQTPFHEACRNRTLSPEACAVDWILTVRSAINRAR